MIFGPPSGMASIFHAVLWTLSLRGSTEPYILGIVIVVVGIYFRFEYLDPTVWVLGVQRALGIVILVLGIYFIFEYLDPLFLGSACCVRRPPEPCLPVTLCKSLRSSAHRTQNNLRLQSAQDIDCYMFNPQPPFKIPQIPINLDHDKDLGRGTSSILGCTCRQERIR